MIPAPFCLGSQMVQIGKSVYQRRLLNCLAGLSNHCHISCLMWAFDWKKSISLSDLKRQFTDCRLFYLRHVLPDKNMEAKIMRFSQKSIPIVECVHFLKEKFGDFI